MKKLHLIIYLLPLFAFFACNSGDDSNDNIKKNGVLIFGWYASSSCEGNCATIYKMENGKIYKDIATNFPESTFFEGNFQLVDAEYQDYQALMASLPNELFDEPNGYLDCPNCTDDNGGYYLEFRNDNGFHKSWRFHNVKHPDYMINYRSLLISKLAELNGL